MLTEMSTVVGERTRAAILAEAARLATVEGIEGLSIGQLAEATGMSKSGLYAHFRSKEELQLATISTAHEIFQREVLDPAMAAPEGERLRALCEAFLSHVERDVFPGGRFCAAAAAELAPRRNRVRDAIADWYKDSLRNLEGLVREAQAAGKANPAADPVQLTFEVNAVLSGTNADYILLRDPAVFERAREAIGRLLKPPRRR
jgi:AcrR family transcriptional regulator